MAKWLLTLVVPRGPVRDGLLGDLEERLQRHANESRWRGSLWYWGEAVAASARYSGEAVRLKVERTRGGMGMEGWMRDLRLAVRGVARRPGFSAAVVLTLALGIPLWLFPMATTVNSPLVMSMVARSPSVRTIPAPSPKVTESGSPESALLNLAERSGPVGREPVVHMTT